MTIDYEEVHGVEREEPLFGNVARENVIAGVTDYPGVLDEARFVSFADYLNTGWEVNGKLMSGTAIRSNSMLKKYLLSVVIAAVMLISMLAVPANGQTPTVLGLKAGRIVHAQRFESPVGAMPDAVTDPGIIAYVRLSTHDIHLISPNGAGDHVLWTAPQPLGPWGPLDLAWRPDGRELAFSSDHEQACSWYETDVYTISLYGGDYRRITNSPACAVLAGLPKGSVTVDVANYTSALVWVYVQGAPGVQSILGSGTVTFNDVADFGPGVLQPSIGIWGLYRLTSYPPYADVQPGQTVPGGNIVIMQYSGFSGFGAGKVSWKAGGSALAYGMRSASGIEQISANPSYGSIGVDLPVAENTSPSLVAWGPTPATKDQYLYSSGMDVFEENVGGIYLNTVGDTSGGTQLLFLYDYDGSHIHDIEWLPDGSGFLYSVRHVELGIFSDIFEYNFATPSITQLTPSLDDENGAGGAREISISPDGQQIAFERAVYPLDTSTSVWIMNYDGSNLHKLADDAGRPAWGKTPAPLDKHVYIAMAVK